MLKGIYGRRWNSKFCEKSVKQLLLRYLVLIDGSCKGGYNALMEARDYILMGGCELHREQTRQVLMEGKVLNEEAECILTDQQLSNYMRYNLIKNMVRLE